jgi:hypothetical protein
VRELEEKSVKQCMVIAEILGGNVNRAGDRPVAAAFDKTGQIMIRQASGVRPTGFERG